MGTGVYRQRERLEVRPGLSMGLEELSHDENNALRHKIEYIIRSLFHYVLPAKSLEQAKDKVSSETYRKMVIPHQMWLLISNVSMETWIIIAGAAKWDIIKKEKFNPNAVSLFISDKKEENVQNFRGYCGIILDEEVELSEEAVMCLNKNFYPYKQGGIPGQYVYPLPRPAVEFVRPKTPIGIITERKVKFFGLEFGGLNSTVKVVNKSMEAK